MKWLFILVFLLIINCVTAQPGPPPQHGNSGDQPVGGSAPIGSGLIILLILGAGYGSKKVYDQLNSSRNEAKKKFM